MGKRLCGVLLVAWFAAVRADEVAAPRRRIEFRAAESAAAPGLTEMAVQGQDHKVYVYDHVLLANEEIESATVRKQDPRPGRTEILLVFTEEGKRKFAEATAQSLKKPLAILVDGVVVSAPTVQTPIVGGSAVITGSFTPEEARQLVEALHPNK